MFSRFTSTNREHVPFAQNGARALPSLLVACGVRLALRRLS